MTAQVSVQLEYRNSAQLVVQLQQDYKRTGAKIWFRILNV